MSSPMAMPAARKCPRVRTKHWNLAWRIGIEELSTGFSRLILNSGINSAEFSRFRAIRISGGSAAFGFSGPGPPEGIHRGSCPSA